MLAMMSLADGNIDQDKIDLVREYADAVGVEEAYLRIFVEATAGEIDAAAACMMRKNAETFPGLDIHGIDEDRINPFSLTATGEMIRAWSSATKRWANSAQTRSGARSGSTSSATASRRRRALGSGHYAATSVTFA